MTLNDFLLTLHSLFNDIPLYYKELYEDRVNCLKIL